MQIVPKIACRTIGTAGVALALYDSVKLTSQYSHIGSEHAEEEYLEDSYFKGRTIDKVSHSSNAIREKAFELRTKNPLPGIWGRVKGGFEGLMYGLGNYLPVIAFSTLALAGKNKLAKLGAAGVVGCALYKVIRNGFGIGKNNPMG